MNNKEQNVKTFDIPVEWSVYAKVPVKARNLKEALAWLYKNKDLIPLAPYAEYIDGSYRLYDEDAYLDDEEEYIGYLEDVYNATGYLEDFTADDAYKDYCYDWCKDRGYDYYSFDEELGQNGECYSCYDEFIDNDFLDYINGDLL